MLGRSCKGPLDELVPTDLLDKSSSPSFVNLFVFGAIKSLVGEGDLEALKQQELIVYLLSE